MSFKNPLFQFPTAPVRGQRFRPFLTPGVSVPSTGFLSSTKSLARASRSWVRAAACFYIFLLGAAAGPRPQGLSTSRGGNERTAPLVRRTSWPESLLSSRISACRRQELRGLLGAGRGWDSGYFCFFFSAGMILSPVLLMGAF